MNSVTWGPEYDPAHPLWDVGGWFIKSFGGNPGLLAVRSSFEDSPLDLSAYSALVLTGSPSAAYDKVDWIERLKSLVRAAVEKQLPTLGVCFGSQLIAEALGGKVELNPAGWEIGDLEVELTPEGAQDPLFEGMSNPFRTIESHQDAVLELPPGAVLLATNSHCRVQAFGIGQSLRAVQFHPEMGPEHLRFIVPPRRDRILASSNIDVDKLLEGLRDTPMMGKIFRNFERNFVRGG
jgi:GMP synthase (glutamine-hydrolysing)